MDRLVNFFVLGPLMVTIDSSPVPIPAGRQRALLAALLLKANEVVPVDELIDRLWDDDLPHRPRGALHTCLTRVRQALDGQGAGVSELIQTSAAGYMIELSADHLDLLRFRNLAASARSAAERGDLQQESATLAQALSLWRGPVLTDVRSAAIHRDLVPKLTEEWLHVLERWHMVSFALGRHPELVGELRFLVRKYPFHERFWHLLVLALYRCGRQVEALQAYGEVSGYLREELGVDPGEELRRLHLAILRGDPRLMTADLGCVSTSPSVASAAR
ncbi:MAG TPA: AfsR/SARP family transcriptional regulator [Streptosporangiaceae bacterium]|nr:AfsR/SARP family transcriptional regulator [Streptosporangiaceae bacterium]